MKKEDYHSAYSQPVYDDEPDCYHDRAKRGTIRLFLYCLGLIVVGTLAVVVIS